MDFINRHLKVIRTSVLVVVTLFIFGLSYYICITNIKPYSKTNKDTKITSDALEVHSNTKNVLSSSAGIIFKTKYVKSGEVVREKEEDAVGLSGKTKEEVEEAFKNKGYKVESMTATQAVLIKEVNAYSPNKYVLGIKDNFIAIYRTDKDGNMYIENEKRDITDIKIDKLKKADIDLLIKGDGYFQCNSREDAQARLEDYE